MSGPTGPGEAAPAAAREEVQRHEALGTDRGVVDVDEGVDGEEAIFLDWQDGELDSALEAIDSRLPVKRRRATDPPGTPPFPRQAFRQLTVTPEILDALAMRVAERLKADGQAVAPVTSAACETRPGPRTVISIRFRWPLFSFRLFRRRRRRRLLTSFSS
ncbi:MAG: hypothetical protein A3J29_00155 [Acidobacteria bacterium RIFCSPLOWO2_12_FULL_67_14b]|nr:MAG: hypothetical protein A3J29_00155 [Acidobacteria bacterium RIFCSPLOWO2_12_FULL_67_14b]